MIKTLNIENFKLPNNANRIVITRLSNGINRFILDNKEIDESLLPLALPVSIIKAGKLKYNIKASLVNLKDIIDKHIKNNWVYIDIKEEYAIFVKENETKKVFIGDTNRNIIYYKYSIKGSLSLSDECSLEVFTKSKEIPIIPESINITTIVGNFFNISNYLPKEAKEVKVLKINLPYIKGITSNILVHTEYPITINYFTPEVVRMIKDNSDIGYSLSTISKEGIVLVKGGNEKVLSLPNADNMYIDFEYSIDNMYFSKKSRIYFILPEVDVIEEAQLPPKAVSKIIHISSRNIRYAPKIQNKVIEIYD